jgi:rubrerythrin
LLFFYLLAFIFLIPVFGLPMEDRILMEQVLDFAMGEEQAAADFYLKLAARTKVPGMREVFEGFALEEKRHKAKLETIKLAGILEAVPQEPVDLKISDYVVETGAPADLDYRGALQLALRKETAAFKLYGDMAVSAPTETLKKTFLLLAREEAAHLHRFESELKSL